MFWRGISNMVFHNEKFSDNGIHQIVNVLVSSLLSKSILEPVTTPV